jgi:hypothetical protein
MFSIVVYFLKECLKYFFNLIWKHEKCKLLPDSSKNIYNSLIVLFYWRNEDLFSLKNIYKKKYSLHNINIYENNLYINFNADRNTKDP